MVFLLAIITLVFTVLIFWVKHVKNKATYRSQAMGVNNIKLIKQVIVLSQQHRGLMAAWLNGDKRIKVELDKRKQKINSLIKSLDATNIGNEERWTAFKDHWLRLMAFEDTENVLNSFEQHTKMIRNLAYFLEDTAEGSYLTSDYLIELPHVGLVWRELVLVAESVGQSRAIGTAVAAQSFCSSVDKIRLNFLTQTIKTTTKETLSTLSYLPEEKKHHRKLIDLAEQQIKKLTDIILHDLINTKKVAVDHHEYYQLATDTIELLNNVFDHQLAQVESVL